MEDTRTLSIAEQNSKRLGHLSTLFCLMNGISITPVLVMVFSQTVMGCIAQWYNEHGREDFDPEQEIIGEEAIKYAFAEMQRLTNEARDEAEAESEF